MTYNVFGETLNLAQSNSILRTIRHADSFSSGGRLARRLCHLIASQTH